MFVLLAKNVGAAGSLPKSHAANRLHYSGTTILLKFLQTLEREGELGKTWADSGRAKAYDTLDGMTRNGFTIP